MFVILGAKAGDFSLTAEPRYAGYGALKQNKL